MNYIVYTDGAYSATRGIGAISFLIIDENKKVICRFSKVFIGTTNQRMEQLAVAVALESIKTPSNVTVYSDSAYVVETYNSNWKRKANLDLWERLDKAKEKHKVMFVHVKGHNNERFNEECDLLATQAISSYKQD